MVPVHKSGMRFVAWSTKSVSLTRGSYLRHPAPFDVDNTPVGHNVLFASPKGLAYYSPRLVREGRVKSSQEMGVVGLPTWHGRYDRSTVEQNQRAQPPPHPKQGKGRRERWDLPETWSKGWSQKVILKWSLLKRPVDFQQPPDMWIQRHRLILPQVKKDFIQHVPWTNLPPGQSAGTCVARGHFVHR